MEYYIERYPRLIQTIVPVYEGRWSEPVSFSHDTQRPYFCFLDIGIGFPIDLDIYPQLVLEDMPILLRPDLPHQSYHITYADSISLASREQKIREHIAQFGPVSPTRGDNVRTVTVSIGYHSVTMYAMEGYFHHRQMPHGLDTLLDRLEVMLVFPASETIPSMSVIGVPDLPYLPATRARNLTPRTISNWRPTDMPPLPSDPTEPTTYIGSPGYPLGVSPTQLANIEMRLRLRPQIESTE